MKELSIRHDTLGSPKDGFNKQILTVNQKEKLARLPLASLVKTKSLIMDPVKDQMKQSIKNENIGLDQLRGSPANLEAIAAFREKRDPNFENC
mgnify:CR=1 FL=1